MEQNRQKNVSTGIGKNHSRVHLEIRISYITSVKDVSNLKLPEGAKRPRALNWIHPSHEGYN